MVFLTNNQLFDQLLSNNIIIISYKIVNLNNFAEAKYIRNSVLRLNYCNGQYLLQLVILPSFSKNSKIFFANPRDLLPAAKIDSKKQS